MLLRVGKMARMRGAQSGGGDTTSYEPPSQAGGADAQALGLMCVAPEMRFDPLRDGMVISRTENCAILLRSEQVSRRHASVQRDGPLWLLKDTRSKNGTFVNGARAELVSLKPQDTVRVGDWIAVICTMPRSVVH